MKDFIENLKNLWTDFVHDIKFKFNQFKTSLAGNGKNRTVSNVSGIKDRFDSWMTSSRAIPVLSIALAVLVVILAIVLLLGGGVEPAAKSDQRALMDKVRSKNVIKCHINSVNEMFETYYSALSVGDSQILDTLYDEPSKARYSISVSEIVDRYGEITVYVTPGLADNEMAAFVYNNIYFNNIKEAAPSVDSYYIKVDEENKKVQIITKMYSDEEINNFLTLISLREPVRSLLSSTEDSLYGILEKNSELRNLYVIMSTMTEQK